MKLFVLMWQCFTDANLIDASMVMVVMKYHDQKQLRGEVFILASDSRGLDSTMVGEGIIQTVHTEGRGKRL